MTDIKLDIEGEFFLSKDEKQNEEKAEIKVNLPEVEQSAIKEEVLDPLQLEFIQPLPEKIDFLTIPKINETRPIWKKGIKQLEKAFAEHIAIMNTEFNDRAEKWFKV